MIGRGPRTPKKEPTFPLFSHLKTSLGSMPDLQDVVKGLKKASPQILATVVGGLAIAALVNIWKKKE